MVIALDTLAASFVLAAATALLMIGAVTAWTAANAARRAAGVVVALTGSLSGLAALGAPSALLAAAIAVMLASAALGAAIFVRLQEVYGSIETPEVDAEDQRADSPERDA